MPVSLCLYFTGSALDQGTAIVDGYNSYYGFPRSKSGYSGKAKFQLALILTSLCFNNTIKCNKCVITVFLLQGVATYCKDAFTPFRAEEGLSGLFSSSDAVDSVGCYGNIRAEFSKMELRELDFEGRAVITQHKIKVSYYQIKLLIYPAIAQMEFHNVHSNYPAISEADVAGL
jgi:AP endonuclease-2